jgi:hypothetical protein
MLHSAQGGGTAVPTAQKQQLRTLQQTPVPANFYVAFGSFVGI